VLSPLVDRAQQGDEDAFVALTQAVGDRCMAIAYRILRDAGLAEDAVQTALTTAWRELPALRDRDRFEPWLHRTLVNICYAEAKRRRRAPANVLALVPDVLQTPDATLTVHDRDQLERGFRRLPPEQRAVLVFHYYLGYTVAEVSDHLGIPARDCQVASSLRDRVAAGGPGGRCPHARELQGASRMTIQTDPDRRLELFLDEGPEVLPDRVLDGVRDDIHRMRQRGMFGPRRYFTMRKILGSAAVVAILLAGGGTLWANRDAFTGSATPEPTATPTPAEPQGELTPRATYQTTSFSQPFSFTLPGSFEDGGVRGDVWPDRHTFDLQVSSGGAVTFHDEAILSDDPCRITGTIPDVPDDVGGWLTGGGGSTVSAPSQLSGAARSVTYWDIELGGECFVGDPAALPSPGPNVWFCSREQHRVYDVDMGSDHVLVITWPDGYCGEGNDVLDELNRLTDSLVASMR
jgi:RNA polymerase sigma factor (sigma-70 family)